MKHLIESLLLILVLIFSILAFGCASNEPSLSQKIRAIKTQVTLSDVVEKIDRMVPRSGENAVLYFRDTEKWYGWCNGILSNFQAKPFPMSGSYGQSGSSLLLLDNPFTNKVDTYSVDESSNTMMMPGGLYVSTLDIKDRSVFRAGWNSTELTFEKISGEGKALNRFTVPLEKINRKTMYSFFTNTTWHVWVPTRNKIFVFDEDLNLQKEVSIELPSFIEDFEWEIVDQIAELETGPIEELEAFGKTLQNKWVWMREGGFYPEGQDYVLNFRMARLIGKLGRGENDGTWDSVLVRISADGRLLNFQRIDEFIVEAKVGEAKYLGRTKHQHQYIDLPADSPRIPESYEIHQVELL